MELKMAAISATKTKPIAAKTKAVPVAAKTKAAPKREPEWCRLMTLPLLCKRRGVGEKDQESIHILYKSKASLSTSHHTALRDDGPWPGAMATLKR